MSNPIVRILAAMALYLAACESAPAPSEVVVERFSGGASYYADKFQGRPTASGEPFDQQAFTAAHRELAFGTRVRVTRRETGASVVVRVNDRGPFADDRVIDLSRVAAEKLDIIDVGVAEVDVEVLGEPDAGG